ncbi:cyclic nucleotide-gated cation channel beta-1-like isoform X5 [Polyodon spathula]|uniref:cyclic nucleotide-gated cation channel beta-1-like isoform X5 n=1 Tax=Polyodon spathula TaxID=7913 RepID=UPI001B7E965F|nr:cyclic nucleotide-gated cation channel beta-1-like isoform X5 [Polyodon spathula]
MGTWTEHKHQQQETEKNTMKTFLLLTSLLAVAPVSQAAEVKLTLGEGFEKALLDLASGGQQKREEGFADDSDESQVKRELGFADDSDESQGEKRELGFADDSNESQGEKRELDESDFLGGGGELDGLVDDLEQKREMGFADDSDESQGEKKELGFADDSDERQGEKRELGFADDSDERQGEKRELGFADDSNESQGEKRELDESDFLGGGGELDGLVDDLEQKREMGFADDSDESQGGKRELAGSENKGLQGKRWLGCRNGYRSTTCYYTQSCQHYHYRRCTGGSFPSCSNQLRLRCLMVKRRCVRRRRCRNNYYYRYRPCYRCTYRRWWKNM